jgi:hypothetical protein
MASGDLSIAETSIANDGEERLWFAVLIQSLNDFISGKREPQGSVASRELRATYSREAEHWFFDDSYEVGSFVWVANVLSIDPDILRGWLVNEKRLNRRLRREYHRRPTRCLAAPESVAIEAAKNSAAAPHLPANADLAEKTEQVVNDRAACSLAWPAGKSYERFHAPAVE